MSFLKRIKFLLFPFAVLYNLGTTLRNKMYDVGILKSLSFNIPVITVGNLNVGGTGKTPHIEYLIRLLKNKNKTATLSRGYKRKTKGYRLASKYDNTNTLGDEPMQFYSKFGEEISVAVAENRVEGVKNLLKQVSPQVILLDDAFQHRALKAKLSVLLTAYDDLFTEDYLLPFGRLRESRAGAKRADIIVVTKCTEVSTEDKRRIIRKIKRWSGAKVYFSRIEYDTQIYGKNILSLKDIAAEDVLLITGIANPKPIIEYLKDTVNHINHLAYADHYDFSEKHARLFLKKADNSIIITTEKDYMRLQKFDQLKELLYYLPIQIVFDTASDFNLQVLRTVK